MNNQLAELKTEFANSGNTLPWQLLANYAAANGCTRILKWIHKKSRNLPKHDAVLEGYKNGHDLDL
jgi:hypothetical protein